MAAAFAARTAFRVATSVPGSEQHRESVVQEARLHVELRRWEGSDVGKRAARVVCRRRVDLRDGCGRTGRASVDVGVRIRASVLVDDDVRGVGEQIGEVGDIGHVDRVGLVAVTTVIAGVAGDVGVAHGDVGLRTVGSIRGLCAAARAERKRKQRQQGKVLGLHERSFKTWGSRGSPDATISTLCAVSFASGDQGRQPDALDVARQGP
jgi:hypothetical protein